MSSTRLAASPRIQERFPSFLEAWGTTPPQPAGTGSATAYKIFMHPVTPIAFAIVYFALAKTLSHYQSGKNRIQGKGWNAAVICHNLLLAGYSGWTAFSTGPLILGSFIRGFKNDGLVGKSQERRSGWGRRRGRRPRRPQTGN